MGVLADTGCIFIVVSRIEKRPWGLDKPRCDLGGFHRSDSMKSGLKWLPHVDSAVCKTILLLRIWNATPLNSICLATSPFHIPQCDKQPACTTSVRPLRG